MAIGRKPSGAYDAAYPINLPDGSTGYASARVIIDQNGNPIPGGGGGAVTIADGADVAEGATTAAAYTDQTGSASGTVVGLLKGLYTALKGVVSVSGNVAPGGASAGGNPVQVAGTDGTNVRTIRTDNTGRATVRIVDGNGTDITSGIAGNDAVTAAVSSLSVSGFSRVFNGSTWDRARGDATGTYTVPGFMPAATDRSGTATTTSSTLAAANSSRRGLNIQNIGANNIGVNEFGGTAAIGTAGTYTLAPGASMNVRTNRAVTVIAATASTAYSATEF